MIDSKISAPVNLKYGITYIKAPVDIKIGGKIIFFSFTGNFCAFIRITMTTIPINNANTMEKTKYAKFTPSYTHITKSLILLYFLNTPTKNVLQQKQRIVNPYGIQSFNNYYFFELFMF